MSEPPVGDPLATGAWGSPSPSGARSRVDPSPLPPPVRVEIELGGRKWLIHVKARAVSVSVDRTDNFTFDLEGRPYAAFVHGRNYRRGLDGRVLLKCRTDAAGEAHRERRFLDAAECAAFLRQVRERMLELKAGILATRTGSAGGDRERTVAWLARLARWDETALAAHARQFHRVYRTVSILPPDQYMALVVQSSEGCPWNRCAFCRLYRDRRYRLKSADELHAHLAAITQFVGAAIRLRRSVFLGDANMLSAPGERIRETLRITAAQVAAAGGPEGPFYGFADAGGVRRHGPGELEALRKHGLRRVYLGLESGHDPLLAVLDKPSRSRDMVEAVQRLHAADLQAGIIVLLGLGGRKYAAAHEQDTVTILRSMELGRGDIVYFSPLIAYSELEYARRSRAEGWEALDSGEMRRQQARMIGATGYPPGAPLTSIYDIRDFIY